jgi:hypothetical membrane protein
VGDHQFHERGALGHTSTSWAWASAWAGILGPLLFTTLVVQGRLQPEYSHVRMPISALTAWPTGWIQFLNFLVVAVLMIVFAVGLNADIKRTRWGGLGFALLSQVVLGLCWPRCSPGPW